MGTQMIVDSSDIRPPIPYDFNAGDERKVDREAAMQRAIERTHDRGCRQSVRASTAPHFVDGPFWLIQDVR